MQARDLVWDGCLNVRDLGGHATRDGRTTRFGVVVRADSVRQLSEDGWAALLAHGIRTVVDLRGHDELRDDPPPHADVELVHVPFLETDEGEWQEIGPELDAAAAAAPDHATATRDVYLIFLERFGPNVAAGLRAVAEARQGGVVVHCAGGKDRTGLLTAFLLHAAGVELGAIAADYALSEERLRPRADAWLATAETEAERERVRRISATPAAAILGVFHELERRYGSVEGYLLAAGVDKETLERLRERLLGEPRMAAA